MPYLEHEAGGWDRVNKPHDAESAGEDDVGDAGLSAVVDWKCRLLLYGDLGGVSDGKDSYLHRHLFRQQPGFCNNEETGSHNEDE